MIAAGATVVLILLTWRLSRVAWNPSSDLALIELRVRDVGTRHTPLVGPFSREGWNHPGPLLFYLLALPYRLLGGRSGGLLAGALMVNLASLTGSLWLLRHLGGRLLLGWGALLLALLVRALGGLFLLDPWNPRVGVLPLFALVLVAWWLADGDTRALPVGVALGSFLVQSHVGYGIPVVALLSVGIGAHLLGRGPRAGRSGGGSAESAKREPRPRLVPAVAAAAGVGLALWLPPLVAEATDGGNLGELWRWAFADAPVTGIGQAWEFVAPQLAWRPPWITGDEPLNYLTGAVRVGAAPLPLALAGLAAAAVVAWRRHDRAALHGVTLAATTVAAAVISIARIRGFVYDYLTQWLWVVGALCWLAAGRALLPALPERARGAAERIGAPLALSLAAAVAAWPAWQVVRRPVHEPYASVAIGAVAAEATGGLDGCERVDLTDLGGEVGFFLVPGFALQLERRGYDVLWEPRRSDQVGTHRTALTAYCTIVFASGDAVEEVADETGLSPIAAYDSHTPEERRAEEEFLAHFEEVMSIPGITLDDPRVEEIQRELERRSHRPPVVHVAVYRTR